MSDETNYIDLFFKIVQKLVVNTDQELTLGIDLDQDQFEFIKKVYPKIMFTSECENKVCLTQSEDQKLLRFNKSYFNFGLKNKQNGVIIERLDTRNLVQPPFLFLTNHSQYSICFTTDLNYIYLFLELVVKEFDKKKNKSKSNIEKKELIVFVPDVTNIRDSNLLEIGKKFDTIEVYHKNYIKSIKNNEKDYPLVLRIKSFDEKETNDRWSSFVKFSSDYIFIDSEYLEKVVLDTLVNFDKYVCIHSSDHFFDDLKEYTNYKSFHSIKCYKYKKPLPDALENDDFKNRLSIIIKTAVLLKENQDIFDIMNSNILFLHKQHKLNDLNNT
jgi:hypothetical protein